MRYPSAFRGLIAGIVLFAAVVAAFVFRAQAPATPGPDDWTIELEVATLGETGLVIDRPLGWRRGGVYGENLLISLLGGAGMYPNFNAFREEMSGSDPIAMIDEAFEDLLVMLPGSRVDEAGWISSNGVDAHRSVVSWDSHAGRLKALRLFVPVTDGVAVLTWVAEADLFDELAGLFDRCARSLRPDPELG